MIHSRLFRYGVAGGLSLLSHLVVLLLLVELAGWNPVLSSVLGFCVSVVVSFSLQHFWVFQHGLGMLVTFPRFLLVTLFGLALNTTIMALGTGVFHWHYLPIQLIAFAAVPISNYLLNRAWTFRDPTDDENLARRPAWHWLALGLMTLVTLLMAPLAAMHLDLARDLLVAFDIIDARSYPVLGPPLAGLFHLGPVWYYLLALFQALGLDVAGTVGMIMLLASLRYVLLYRAGELWLGQTTGLVWAALLLVPGWVTLELFLIHHPALTVTLVAMVLVFGLRFVQSGRSLNLVLMGLSFSLALHAHPSALVIVLLPIGFLVLGWIEHGPRWRGLALAGLLGLLPFVPMLVDLHLSGWPILEQLADYNAARQNAPFFSTLLALGWALTGGGLHYWFEHIIGAPALLGWLTSLIFLSLCLVGLAGSVKRAIAGDWIALLLLASLASGLIGLSLIRDVHPYYMLAPVYVLLCGLVAGGLTAWPLAAPARRAAPSVVLALGLLALVPSAYSLFEHQRAGHWPFALLPMFDVKEAAVEHAPHPFLSSAGSRQSGRWLCRHPGVTVHGPYALSLLHSYGVEARLTCGRADIRLSETDVHDAIAVVGLTRRFREATSRERIASVGIFDLVPLVQDLGQADVIELEDFRSYPSYEPGFHAARYQELAIVGSSQQYLIMTDLGFALGHRPRPSLHCGRARIEPLVEDNISWLWQIPECAVPVSLVVAQAKPARLDIAIF